MAIHASCGLAMLLTLGSPAWAGDCRLALVLALDVSSSVNRDEHQLQRQGLARSLVAPEVVRAFLSGDPVALYIFEWSGPATQTPLLQGWQWVSREEDLSAIAALVASRPRSAADNPHRPTAVGMALSFAVERLHEAPDCRAWTIDVSGDGESNDGLSPAAAFEVFPLDGVTVNALVVGGALDSRGEPANDLDLVAYFEAEVLHGPGAFCVLADGYEDYERAMRIKLERELQAPMMSGWPVWGPRRPLG